MPLPLPGEKRDLGVVWSCVHARDLYVTKPAEPGTQLPCSFAGHSTAWTLSLL